MSNNDQWGNQDPHSQYGGQQGRSHDGYPSQQEPGSYDYYPPNSTYASQGDYPDEYQQGYNQAHPAGQKKLSGGIAALVVGLPIIALGAGVAVGAFLLREDPTETAEYKNLQSEHNSLANDVLDAQSEIESLESVVTERDGVIEELERQLADVDPRASDLTSWEEELTIRQTELDTFEAELLEREESVINLEEIQAVNVIDQGVWTVGLDIEPGTYRVVEPIDESQFCYWAIYTTGTNQEDIVNNGIPTGGHPQVTLSEGQDFESSDCGTWVMME